ncbi:hypothetical protein Btru_016342 [Bulinus truncatus]|nr:hypothetical protein Btru_016342 [Bulinus truncatus]
MLFRSPWKRQTYVILAVSSFLITVVILRYIEFMNVNLLDQTFSQASDKNLSYNQFDQILYVTMGPKVLQEIDWPSLRNTNISLQEIQDKYRRCTARSISNNVKCAELHKGSVNVWRSASKSGMTKNKDFERMNLASSCCAFYYEDLMKPAPVEELFLWEQNYLSSPYLQRLDDIAWANLSTIQLVSPEGENVSVTIGSKVTFKIVLFNGRKERRTVGGDKIEVWLVGDDIKAAITADVIDNMDGTYTAETLLPWSGSVKVMAAIAHHRELFRTMAYIQRVFKTTHWFTGNFISPRASEATPCSPFPSLPEYPLEQICNLTDVNGLPWYCGRPVKSDELNCSHFQSVTKLDLPSYLPLAEAEEMLINMTEQKRPFLIPNDIVIKVVPVSIIEVDHDKYFLTELIQTFSLGTWRPLDCKQQDITVDIRDKCLKDTQLILIGDSNGRRQYEILTSILPCEEKIKRTTVIWHAPLRCDNDNNKMSIRYFPHKFPFYGSLKEDIKNEALYSEVNMLDEIPKDGKYVVYIHLFLHLVPFHLSLADQRLRLIREATKRLLARNSRVIVVFQSAHSAYDRTPMNKHKMGAFLLELQRNILKGLGDRVMFVLTWPMTAAVANADGHPQISNIFTHYYLAYVCGRL